MEELVAGFILWVIISILAWHIGEDWMFYSKRYTYGHVVFAVCTLPITLSIILCIKIKKLLRKSI
jgi:predicted tellurium resistance membrane protein TerC